MCWAATDHRAVERSNQGGGLRASRARVGTFQFGCGHNDVGAAPAVDQRNSGPCPQQAYGRSMSAKSLPVYTQTNTALGLINGSQDCKSLR